MMDGEEFFTTFLRSRRSIRHFSDRAVDVVVLRRLIEAATTAPSSTNRQPWRFAVVTSKELRAKIVGAVRDRTAAMQEIIRRSHHAEAFGAYGDFFYEPLESAAVIVIPQYREHPDQIAYLLEAGGGDPSAFHTPASMQVDLCSTSAAVMTMLLQAHAEGIGACWMAGPTVAKDEIHALLGIREPWRMLGAVALGHAAAPPKETPARRPLDRVVTFFDDEAGEPDGDADKTGAA
jgi:coenzyme F420-0:L-glutamate ligase/coenzyme F420-1:gamma-L-glutamate ligase